MAELDKLIHQRIKKMQKYAQALDFEKAAEIRDEVNEMKKVILEADA